jgi:hypothetical protein
MSTEEIFDSCVRTTGDLAGVFEYDGETGYFYLYKTERAHGEKVLESIHVLSGQPDFTEVDISVRWDLDEQKVGLFIRDALWAVFDGTRRLKYGGGYEAGAKPSLPAEAMIGFVAAS